MGGEASLKFNNHCMAPHSFNLVQLVLKIIFGNSSILKSKYSDTKFFNFELRHYNFIIRIDGLKYYLTNRLFNLLVDELKVAKSTPNYSFEQMTVDESTKCHRIEGKNITAATSMKKMVPQISFMFCCLSSLISL